jgi:DNA helicase-2/ATP-dependent DNA helicase PcrA
MTTEAFDKLYGQLNPQQREAVDSIEGPVMVVAGPGTGKTQVLTLRIANILRKTDTPPEAILALTFTESGVISMRRRLASIIGSPAYRVRIATFHGFTNGVIQEYPEEFPRIVGATPMTEVDQIGVVEAAVEALPLEELKPFGDPGYYVRTIAARLGDLKREGVTREDFRRIVEEAARSFEAEPERYHTSGPHLGKMKGEWQRIGKQIAKNRELAAVYERYEEMLSRDRRYDYSDMIMETLRALEGNGDLLLALQERHQYLLADEHQDANNAQNRILELLASFHPNPNLFVVGDEKQAIFRFQGASLENFRYFAERFPGAKLITLTENYRSSQTILDAAGGILSGPEPLHSSLTHTLSRIQLAPLDDIETEASFVAASIRAAVAEGARPEEIAVLYRDNKDAALFARALERMSIPATVESDDDLLAHPDVRKLVMLLKAVHHFGEPEPFIEALHLDFLEILPLDIYKLSAAAAKGNRSVHDLARSAKTLREEGCEEPEGIAAFHRMLSGWATGAKNQPLPELLEWIVRESGLLADMLRSTDAPERLAALETLFRSVEEILESHREYGLGDLMQHFDMVTAHRIGIKRGGVRKRAGRVRLMTAHRAKGLEFDIVYLTGATDGHWGNRRSSDPLPLLPGIYSLRRKAVPEKRGVTTVGLEGAYSGDLADERRLFYVALTRARARITVSWPTHHSDGKELLPSVFVGELHPELTELADTSDISGIRFQNSESAASEKRELKKGPLSCLDAAFVEDLLERNGFSVTALNNYLACPWRYFYTNLLRVPAPKTRHQMYGTAIHAALHDFFASAATRALTREALLAAFERHLAAAPFSSDEHAAALARGRKALGGWYDRYATEWGAPVLTEFAISGVLFEMAEGAPVRLTGKIDKLEFLGDGAEVLVTDYKTGRPKTRAELEGKTKRTTGNELRQLAFYKLLLDRHDGGRYRMRSGRIDFIEPNERGVYRREEFVASEEETQALAETIRRVVSEIRSLAFWDRRCNDSDCHYCALRVLSVQ